MRVVLVLVGLLLTGAPSAQAASGDLVVPDRHVARVFALGDTIAYERKPSGWRRVVDGRRLRAQGVPRGAHGSAIGRDRAGRVVLTMVVSRLDRGRVVTTWWRYDVRRDRAHRLGGLPAGTCAPSAVSVWRERLAYTVSCGRRGASGIFLREHGRVRRIAGSTRWQGPLTLRGDVLAAVRQEADGDSSVWRLVDGGRRCPARLAGSHLPGEYNRFGPWISGRTLLWAVGGGLVGLELDARCGRPGPTGAFDLMTGLGETFVDRRAVYTVARDGIHRVNRPARPVTAPPADDDLASATPLAGDPPFHVRRTIGNATLEEGEPFLNSTGTVWYALRPATSQRIEVATWLPFGIFTGADVRSLANVARRGSDDGRLQVEAAAGQTYYIGVGCSGFACYLPSVLDIVTSSS